MWNQLGVLGSRVVEAVFVSEDTIHQATGAEGSEEGHVISEGRGVEGTVGAEDLEEAISEGRGVEGTVGAVMEGSDVRTLIAKRMGIPKDEVDSRLISLHHKGELAGTADRSAAGPSGKSPTLTKKDLEDFERSEAEARNGTQTGTPFKLALKPAVLGNPATPRTPRTPRTPPAPTQPRPAPSAPARSTPTASAPAHATPAPAAEGQDDDEVEIIVQPQSQPLSGTSNWSEEMDDEEETPPAPVDPAPVDPAKGRSEGSGEGGTVGAVMEGSDVWQEPRKRYEEAVEAEHLYGAIEAIEVPLLDQDDLGVAQLQYVVRDLVGQLNGAHKQLATAGYMVAERSRESLQQAKVSSDMSTEALLKAYEVATLAASISRQSWKMCISLTGPDMPVRTKEAEKRPDTTGRYLAQSLFGVTLKQEEVSIAHFRGATSNDLILKFTRTGFGTSHEDLLHASKALGRNRELQVYAKIAAAEADSEIYFLLRCMVKAREAENSYTARSGRPAAWLVSAEEEGISAPYSFGTVMEVRALMGLAARKEETKRMEGSQAGRRKRALTREAVGSGLKETIRDMGMAEDVIRDEAREKGVIQGGGIRWKDKADVSIFRGIKMDSVPAWADFGRGRGGGRGVVMGARGGYGSRGARGDGGGSGRGARG
jgi:hypothetical protein